MDSHSSSSSSRRVRIPDKPKSVSSSLWTLMKSCIGKDISQVPMPINFNEPLSLLQRFTEQMEYAEILDEAASCTCPYEKMAYLGVFVISGYSNCNRITKPFNPLLGETYEFDRRGDLGWRSISEQVSHHPPGMVQYCEGNGWKFGQEYSFETKFTGKDILVTPTGETNIEFSGGYICRWNKIVAVVHNFIIGGAWVEHQGTVEIVGKNDGEEITCILAFVPGKLKRVEGEVKDGSGSLKWKIEGNFDGQVEIRAVVSTQNNSVEFSKPRTVWKCQSLPEGSESYYSFSTFACQLNEPEEGVAPTDSRCRPDQRLMEEGKWEEAYQEKMRLEDKQRQVIKERMEKEDEKSRQYHPVWFEPYQREDGNIFHKFKGDYWMCKQKKDWSRCPNIY